MAEPEWLVEFRLDMPNRDDPFGYNLPHVRATDAQGKTVIIENPEEGSWLLLAEGTYKECQGHARAGHMQPRPLESCIKRVARMMKRGGASVRLRNIKTGEIIPGEVFI